MRFFGMRLFHEDMWELLFKFGLDAIVVFILIRFIYYPIHRKKDYLFTYFLFNMLIFFLCVLLNSVKLSIGFAFGLFAIFGILRYRTEQISIKDMTYLFAVISLAVINALASKKVSLAELLFTDGMILLMTYVLEHLWLTRHEAVKSDLRTHRPDPPVATAGTVRRPSRASRANGQPCGDRPHRPAARYGPTAGVLLRG